MESGNKSQTERIKDLEDKLFWIRQESEAYSEELDGYAQLLEKKNAKIESDTKLLIENRHTIEKEIKQRIAAEKESVAKSTFLATMSHEIRTPMNGIIGMVELLADTQLTSEQHTFLQTMASSGEILLSVINDILDYSKIESGNLELSYLDFDLNQLVEETIEICAPRLSKNVELSYFIEETVPSFINCDSVRVKQVLINLLNNAVKFTEKGEIILKVNQVVSGPEREMEIHFSVKDSGIGISQENRNALFNDFTQADASITRLYGGSGLGLVICKKLSELMGGQISVESTLGEGSEFSFTIKCLEAKNKIAVKDETKDEILDYFRDKHVLVVDDNATNLLILGKRISHWGMKPHVVESAEEAFTVLETTDCNFAIIDFLMPGTNGIELTKRIRKTRSKNEFPIVMLSSMDVQLSDEEKDLFNARINKPIIQSRLFDLLASTLMPNTNKIKVKSSKDEKQDQTDFAKTYPLTILLVEDNKVNITVATMIFRKIGYEIDVVEDGQQAVEAVEKTDYDLVFMDCQMPVMDGYEATRQIRKLDEPKNSVHIIAMTANAFEEDKDLCFEVGMDGFIPKPVLPKRIKNAIVEFIQV